MLQPLAEMLHHVPVIAPAVDAEAPVSANAIGLSTALPVNSEAWVSANGWASRRCQARAAPSRVRPSDALSEMVIRHQLGSIPILSNPGRSQPCVGLRTRSFLSVMTTKQPAQSSACSARKTAITRLLSARSPGSLIRTRTRPGCVPGANTRTSEKSKSCVVASSPLLAHPPRPPRPHARPALRLAQYPRRDLAPRDRRPARLAGSRRA